MLSSRMYEKHGRNFSAPATAPGMVSQRSKRPSIVDGKVLEPEWDLKPQTYGSFNQDTLARIAQAQADFSRATTEIPQPQSSFPRLSLQASSMKSSTCLQSFSPQQPVSRRYYSNAFSDEDRAALAIGELNHNLSEWSGEKLVQYHASRVELVPYTEEHQATITAILEEKRCSERFVLKSARQAKRFTRNEASCPTNDLRAVSTPNLLLSPTSPAPQTSQEAFPFPFFGPRNIPKNTNGNTGNNGDYISRQVTNDPGARSAHTSKSSRDSSRNRGRVLDHRPLGRKAHQNPSRVRSSLAPETHPYVAKANVTFDAFLAPHASGKGETHRDSIYVKREEEQRSFPRRLSKMPSMPQLKKRASQAFSLG